MSAVRLLGGGQPELARTGKIYLDQLSPGFVADVVLSGVGLDAPELLPCGSVRLLEWGNSSVPSMGRLGILVQTTLRARS